MKLILGTHLSQQLKEQVKKRYTYRLTIENGYPKRNPCHARVKPRTDEEWLSQTAFYLTEKGTLSEKKRYCEPVFFENVQIIDYDII